MLLCVAAAGVVYGDIGTSPLYTWNEIRNHGGIADEADVLGLASLILWTLTLIVSVKYVLLVLRADNSGEGGTYALMGLLQPIKGPLAGLATLMLTGSACLLYSEGLITPAISVLSAVEGLTVANPSLDRFIIPITLVVLFALFYVQYQGTQKVGRLFGVIMVVWFVTIASLGVASIARHPGILQAVFPWHGLGYLWRHGLTALPALGSVVLAVTGGEALYADMGHFGRRAISLSWWILCYPCLMLNYLGQGALLYSGDPFEGDNVFFALVPRVLLYPMIGLATFAAVIASQALISGAFSLTRSAINLGLLPRVLVVHTSSEVEGQIYMPAINWLLWAGCSTLVITFQSSSGLAAAYGLSVMGAMVVTTFAISQVAVHRWGWSPLRAGVVFGGFAVIELTYLAACALKFFDGGFIPLVLGSLLLYLMLTWRRGREQMSQAYRVVERMKVVELLELKRRITALPRAMVFLTQESVVQATDGAPVLLMKFVDRYGGLPKHLTLLSIVNEHGVPYWLGKRFDVVNFGENVVSVRMHVGYMETPDVRAALTTLKRRKLVKIHATRWTIVMGKEEIFLTEGIPLPRRISMVLYRSLLQVASQAHVWFGLGSDTGLSKEVVPVRVSRDGRMEVVLRKTEPGWLEGAPEPG
ncbi:MAG: KUP/HAK/KT family potassium transporter [Deltaproteobacteria bacterium]|nr:KUP/HAK/KT family potassium transporter [Deltaproteobacteria bacterium]